MKKIKILILAIVCLVCFGCSMNNQVPASDSITFKVASEDQAVSQLKSGEMDYYLSSIDSAQVAELENNPDIKLQYAYSKFMGVSLNPAPSKLNPFSLQKVRFAMQYLIDRNEIVQSAYKGFAVPVVVDMIQEHPSYKVIKPSIDEFGINYDKEKALALIDEAMTNEGAEKVGGKWSYNGTIITLSVPIDSDNAESSAIADIVSSELEDAGFEVEKNYYIRGEEDSAPMYATNPAELKWNFYVTGWIFYSASKYQENGFPELTSKEGWWEYNNTAIEDIKEQLKNYSSEQRWEELNNELVKLQLNDSQGIWLIAKKNVFAARSAVSGLAKDDYIGLRSYKNFRTAYVPEKSNLVIGEKYLYEGRSWNPVVIETINMMDVVNTIHDPVIWKNPETLQPEPFRWDYSIDHSEQEVPNDAFIWDVENEIWASASGTAKIKVSYDLSNYINANWHHGQKISWADILYLMSSTWDRAYDTEKQKISGDWLQDDFKSVVGLRINSNSLEVYLNKDDFNDENLLEFSGVFQRIAPWEIYAASDKLVFGNNGFEYGEAMDPELKDLSLVNPEHINKVLTALDSLDYSEVLSYVSVAEKFYLTVQEFEERNVAVHQWYDEHGHLIISDGAFYIDRYNQDDGSIELKAFRD